MLSAALQTSGTSAVQVARPMRSMHGQTKHQSVNPADSAASLVELWDRLAGTMEVEVQADPRGGEFNMIWTLAHTNDAELVQKGTVDQAGSQGN